MLLTLTLVLLQVTAHAQDVCVFDPSLFNAQYWKAFNNKAYRYDVFTADRITTFEQTGDVTELEEQWRCLESEGGEEFGHHHYRYIVRSAANYECREYVNAAPNGLLLRRIIAGDSRPSMEKCKMNLAAEFSWDVMLKYEQGIPHIARCPWAGGEFATVIESTTARCQSDPAIISRVDGSRLTIGDCDIKDKAERTISGNFFCLSSWGAATVTRVPASRDQYVVVYQFDDRQQRPAFYVGRYMETGVNVTMSLRAPDDYTTSFDGRTPATFINEDHFRIDLQRVTTASAPPSTTSTIRKTTRFAQPTTARRLPTTRRSGTTRRPSVTEPCDPDRNPCRNAGTCTDTGTCDCLPGTAGKLCQKVDPTGAGAGNASGVFTTPVLNVVKPDSTTTRAAEPGRSTTTTDTVEQTPAESFNSTALLFDENEERRVFIILITFCVSFAVLSAVLCIVACCRRKRPVFGGDKRSDTLPVAPPSVKDDNLGAVQQAWYPHYRETSRNDDGIDVINPSEHSLEIR